jgi:hypothetical protein
MCKCQLGSELAQPWGREVLGQGPMGRREPLTFLKGSIIKGLFRSVFIERKAPPAPRLPPCTAHIFWTFLVWMLPMSPPGGGHPPPVGSWVRPWNAGQHFRGRHKPPPRGMMALVRCLRIRPTHLGCIDESYFRSTSHDHHDHMII